MFCDMLTARDPGPHGLRLTRWVQDGAFFDEETPGGLVGRDALNEYIVSTHEEMPGLVITETSEPQVLGNRLRVRWPSTYMSQARQSEDPDGV